MIRINKKYEILFFWVAGVLLTTLFTFVIYRPHFIKTYLYQILWFFVASILVMPILFVYEFLKLAIKKYIFKKSQFMGFFTSFIAVGVFFIAALCIGDSFKTEPKTSQIQEAPISSVEQKPEIKPEPAKPVVKPVEKQAPSPSKTITPNFFPELYENVSDPNYHDVKLPDIKSVDYTPRPLPQTEIKGMNTEKSKPKTFNPASCASSAAPYLPACNPK